ncbi:MAG: SpoIIE family protein phosphatase [Actinomycetota bacterium]|nr:SpoIIE family protein phosphatase [Actinomycetota bacterium]
MDAQVAGAIAGLAEATRQGAVVQDDSGTVIWCNEAATVLLGVPKRDLIGQRALMNPGRLCHADGTPLDLGSLPPYAVVSAGRDHAESVVGVTTGDGDDIVRWVEIDTHRVAGAPNGSDYVVSSILDVTHRADTHREMAATLRAFRLSLRPPDLPPLEGIDVDARCRQATGTTIAGGDFYDVMDLGDSTFAFFVGDVQGHGLGPANDTAIARHTLRAAALHTDSPATALSWLHEALSRSESQRSCTAAFGIATTTDRGVEVRYSLAGHPLPLLVRDGAATTFDGVGGPLLGAGVDEVERPVNTAALTPGSAIIFYTDGLTDASTPRLSDDELSALARWHPSAKEIVEDILESTTGDGETFSDDTAVLAILCCPFADAT